MALNLKAFDKNLFFLIIQQVHLKFKAQMIEVLGGWRVIHTGLDLRQFSESIKSKLADVIKLKLISGNIFI